MEGTTLTLDSNTMVHGYGHVGSYNSTPNGGSLVNNGTIAADFNGQILYVQPGLNPSAGLYGTLTSTGTLQAINGSNLYVNAYGGGTVGGSIIAANPASRVYLYGKANLADAMTIRASDSGKVYLVGDYDNQNHTITIADGSLSMAEGTLRNSTVNLSGTGVGLDFSSGSGTLDNVTINGALDVPTNYAYIYNNLTATGGVTLDRGHLQFQTDSTLQGFDITNNGGYVGGGGTTLTFDSSTVVHGYGYVGSYGLNPAGSNLNGGNLVNNGTISADTSGQGLFVQPGLNPSTGLYSAFTNTGTLQAINGGYLYVNPYGSAPSTLGGNIKADGANSSLFLYGTGTLNNATTFTASNGGLVYLAGDYDNQNHTITIADGSLTMLNGALRNSTVNLSGTGVGLDFAGKGTLDNVTINGALNISSDNGSISNTLYAYIYNNLTVTDGITLSGHLQFETDNTLRGGNVTMNGGYLGGLEGTTLTLDSSTVVHGGNSGLIGSYGYSNNPPYTPYGGNLTNNGTISADVSGQALFVQPGYNPSAASYGTLTNTGTLQATNGATLYVNNYGGSGTSTGTIKADANSTVSLNNITQTAGQTIANGTVVTNNTFTLNGGSFIGDGVVSGPLNNTGGTVSPGTLTAAGPLTVNGNYSQDASSQLLIKLGGTIQGTNFDLLSVANTATLHGTLDVQLVNNFTPFVGETFDFLTYANRVGNFDSILPLNGGYTYTVTYNDASGFGTIHVEAVPETGTVVSLGILLMGAGCVIRRLRRQSDAESRTLASKMPA